MQETLALLVLSLRFQHPQSKDYADKFASVMEATRRDFSIDEFRERLGEFDCKYRHGL